MQVEPFSNVFIELSWRAKSNYVKMPPFFKPNSLHYSSVSCMSEGAVTVYHLLQMPNIKISLQYSFVQKGARE